MSLKMSVNSFIHFVGINLFVNFALATALPHSGRIIGGEPAEPTQFPYIVSFQMQAGEFDNHICDASILNKQWILTAARCLIAIQSDIAYIIAGTKLLDTGGIRYNVSTLIPHPDFDLFTGKDDIGLAKIDGEFEFTDTVKAIEIDYVSANDSSIIVGWTSTEDGSPYPLEFTEVTVLSEEDCTKLGQGSNRYQARKPGQVCTFSPNGGMGACYTGGGVLLIYNNKHVGIGSYSLDEICNIHEYPDVFIRTGYYTDWIEYTMATN